MTHREVLEVLAQHRGDRIVLTTMGSVGLWPTISDTPLDYAYLPSSMGQGIAVGLGLALAQSRGVIVLSGDGSLLMNLGSLVTVASHPANLTVLLIDNGLYEVTGGQERAGVGRTDFAGLARAAGIGRVFSFANLDEWRNGIGEVFAKNEPAFVWLKVQGERGKKTPLPPRPMAEQILRLQSAIAGNAPK